MSSRLIRAIIKLNEERKTQVVKTPSRLSSLKHWSQNRNDSHFVRENFDDKYDSTALQRVPKFAYHHKSKAVLQAWFANGLFQTCDGIHGQD